MHEEAKRNMVRVWSDAEGSAPSGLGNDSATVALAYEVAEHSFAWDPELTAKDHERVIEGLLWSVGNQELSVEEWTERVEALQEEALRGRRAAATGADESGRGAGE